MAGGEAEDAVGRVEAEEGGVLGDEGWGGEEGAVVGEGDEAEAEGGVEVRREEEAVEDVEAFGVARAGGPGFDVARAEEGGDGEAGDGAA